MRPRSKLKTIVSKGITTIKYKRIHITRAHLHVQLHVMQYNLEDPQFESHAGIKMAQVFGSPCVSVVTAHFTPSAYEIL